jgi:hypothetical protein
MLYYDNQNIISRRSIMDAAEMETRISHLEDQVRTLRTLLDIEEIKKLQRAYGYYLEHWMAKEIIDLFADADDVSLDFAWYEGTYLGKASIKRYYEGRFKTEPELFHQLMQLSPIIDVSPDGKTARGRWYGCGAVAAPRGKGVGYSIMNGEYENEYVKEGGKWKFKKIRWAMNYMIRPDRGMVSPERLAAADRDFKMTWPDPDIQPTHFNPSYPSGYIFPFHYPHPVTGQKTSEEENNRSVKDIEKA